MDTQACEGDQGVALLTLRAILPVLAFGRNQTTATNSSSDLTYSPKYT